MVINLTAATVGHSNLGGLGPDFGASPTILYRSVGIANNGRAIDLVVSNLTAYEPRNTASNGITNGHFGSINLNGGQFVRLQFDIVDSEYAEPVALDQLYFSVFDIDEGNNNVSRETLWVAGFDSYVHSTSAELEILYAGDREVQITSMARGTGADNPTDPESLTTEQLRRAVQAAAARGGWDRGL